MTALELCDERQRQTLIDNYGDRSQKSVSAVRRIYEEVGLKDIFKIHEENLYRQISAEIERMESEGKPFASTIKWCLQVLVNRKRWAQGKSSKLIKFNFLARLLAKLETIEEFIYCLIEKNEVFVNYLKTFGNYLVYPIKIKLRKLCDE